MHFLLSWAIVLLISCLLYRLFSAKVDGEPTSTGNTKATQQSLLDVATDTATTQRRQTKKQKRSQQKLAPDKSLNSHKSIQADFAESVKVPASRHVSIESDVPDSSREATRKTTHPRPGILSWYNRDATSTSSSLALADRYHAEKPIVDQHHAMTEVRPKSVARTMRIIGQSGGPPKAKSGNMKSAGNVEPPMTKKQRENAAKKERSRQEKLALSQAQDLKLQQHRQQLQAQRLQEFAQAEQGRSSNTKQPGPDASLRSRDSRMQANLNDQNSSLIWGRD